MSWLNVNMEELNKATEIFDNDKGMIEPGVYEGIISECYIDVTKTGTKFLSLEFVTGSFPNDKEIKIIGWDVNRMFMNKDGLMKNKNGGFFTGIILLNKMSKCINKTINDLTQVKKIVEIFNTSKEVNSINDLVGKTLVFGIRHKKYYKQDGSEGIKLDLVNICCKNDNKCIDKLINKINDKPIIEDNSNKLKEEKIDNIDNPF